MANTTVILTGNIPPPGSKAVARAEPEELERDDDTNFTAAQPPRQSRRSVISPDTTRALIVSEGMHETAAADESALIDALAEGVAALWAPPQQRAILTAEAPRLEFA